MLSVCGRGGGWGGVIAFYTMPLHTTSASSAFLCFIAGNLADAQGILKTAISNSKSSASGDQSLCKVLIKAHPHSDNDLRFLSPSC